MIIEGVDPRDIEWEVDEPVYRVYFWHHQAAPAGIHQEHMGYSCDEYRLAGATDVQEVIEWAVSRARPEQTFTLYVEHLQGTTRGLIHLSGNDPTVGD